MSSSAESVLQELVQGNRRFVEGLKEDSVFQSEARRNELPTRHAPSAIILGCSDARVPAEIIFDQGLGALFVIRVAGNVVAPSQVGSVEFAAEQFGTSLVVVLGHSNCGAVEATIAELRRPSDNRSPNLSAIVDRVRPSVQSLVEADAFDSDDKLVHACVRANIRASVNQLRHGSAILERLIASGDLAVVGAEYSLTSGEVDFFDGVPIAG